MKSIHLLLAEDNEGDILLIKEALEDVNHAIELSIVKDGKEALDFISRQGKYQEAKQPDLIMLDVNLPKKNGHEILQFIKGNEVLRHIPVIVLSTSSSEQDIKISYANFANCFITKPINVNEFLSLVTTTITYWITMAKLPGTKTISND